MFCSDFNVVGLANIANLISEGETNKMCANAVAHQRIISTPRMIAIITSKIKPMNKIINVLFWGLFLIALALCSGWCWCKEKIKGK